MRSGGVIVISEVFTLSPLAKFSEVVPMAICPAGACSAERMPSVFVCRVSVSAAPAATLSPTATVKASGSPLTNGK